MSIERSKDEDPGAYFARVLLALTKQAGGELRIPEHLIDLDTRQLLVRDFDPVKAELVFRVGSRYAEAMWVQPRQSAWTIPFEQRARDLSLDDIARHAVPTDEELAARERANKLKRGASRPVAPDAPQ